MFRKITNLFLFMLCLACSPERKNTSVTMANLLDRLHQENASPDNYFANQIRAQHFDSLLRHTRDDKKFQYLYYLAKESLRAGDSEKAATLFQDLIIQLKASALNHDPHTLVDLPTLQSNLALSYLRLGEQVNCLHHHAASSCILPFSEEAVHQFPEGSGEAIKVYENILQENPNNLEARWLLNLAYMTLGEYPQNVPDEWLIPKENFASEYPLPKFENVSMKMGVDVNALSGGVIIEDFNNDQYLDIAVSSWGLNDPFRLFLNQGYADGMHTGFSEITAQTGLAGITGGLNIMQTDYNNDGWADMLILRGAWLMDKGQHPNSLLKNNGPGEDGIPSFTDVTETAGLLSFHPTQTATWADFNNDGWVDLFIGNEARGNFDNHPCELYMNNQDGTFSEIARSAKVVINRYVKGVTSGDYNNDGWVDLYVSTLKGKNYLFENQGVNADEHIFFKDVTEKAGLAKPIPTFPTWFWDYDNDGWLDIFVCEYEFQLAQASPLINYVAADYLNQPTRGARPRLFHNQGDGTFREVSESLGLDQVLYTMGCNFGDLDNDGWLDMYLGTGEPNLNGIMPNRAFRNNKAQSFQDVTSATGLGHLQKGHGIAFGDMDNDGDQDIYAVLGGAFEGDVFPNAFFRNPQNTSRTDSANKWITILLEGIKSNKMGMGSNLRLVVIDENNEERVIHRRISSGSSFGANPLRAEIGLGQSQEIKQLEIQWAGSQTVQTFKNIAPNQIIKIVEGDDNYIAKDFNN